MADLVGESHQHVDQVHRGMIFAGQNHQTKSNPNTHHNPGSNTSDEAAAPKAGRDISVNAADQSRADWNKFRENPSDDTLSSDGSDDEDFDVFDEFEDDAEENSCSGCGTPQSELGSPLSHCAKCKTQFYCSRECQKNDWKFHKKSCSTTTNANADANSNGKAAKMTDFDSMPKPARDFFQTLVSDEYLHSFSEDDMYNQLIDCYRMRVEDDYVFSADNRGLYNQEDPLPDFRRFINLAEKRPGILPAWWSVDKRRACMRKAVLDSSWSDINCAVEKHDIVEHYKDNMMPMKLRLLAEKIYRKKVSMF